MAVWFVGFVILDRVLVSAPSTPQRDLNFQGTTTARAVVTMWTLPHGAGTATRRNDSVNQRNLDTIGRKFEQAHETPQVVALFLVGKICENVEARSEHGFVIEWFALCRVEKIHSGVAG